MAVGHGSGTVLEHKRPEIQNRNEGRQFWNSEPCAEPRRWGQGAGRSATCEYFTRVSPRQRAGQRDGEHGSHGGEHGYAAAEAPGAPQPRSGCRGPAVAMETHGCGRGARGQLSPAPAREARQRGVRSLRRLPV